MFKCIEDVVTNEVFHFEHSLRPFIKIPMAHDQNGEIGEFYFVYFDLHERLGYTFHELYSYEGLRFFNHNEVDVIGKLNEIEGY